MRDKGFYWVQRNPNYVWLIPFDQDESLEIAHYDPKNKYFPWTRMAKSENCELMISPILGEDCYIVVGERITPPMISKEFKQ